MWKKELADNPYANSNAKWKEWSTRQFRSTTKTNTCRKEKTVVLHHTTPTERETEQTSEQKCESETETEKSDNDDNDEENSKTEIKFIWQERYILYGELQGGYNALRRLDTGTAVFTYTQHTYMCTGFLIYVCVHPYLHPFLLRSALLFRLLDFSMYQNCK